MIIISVASCPDQMPKSSAKAQFGREGGSIGRATSNTLVLDDPERTVSRLHAQVVWRNGKYYIIDRGSNPTILNSTKALGMGNEAQLRDGDSLTIGSFVLYVKVLTEAPSTNPAALPAGAASAAQASPSGPLSHPPILTDIAKREDPFSNLLDGLTPLNAHSAEPVTKPPQQDFLPSDPFDVSDDEEPDTEFEDSEIGGLGAIAAPAKGAATPSIDSLFGGNALAQNWEGDPLANSPLGQADHLPQSMDAHAPLAALGLGGGASTSAPRSDHLPIGQFGFIPANEARHESALAGLDMHASAAQSSQASGQFVESAGQVLPMQRAAPMERPAGRRADAQPERAMERRVDRGGNAGGDGGLDSELVQAFLHGLRSPQADQIQITPALMERAGTLLRQALAGTLALLQARQELKNQLRAERTMIVVQGNNPLKFSPSVEVALMHLMGQPVRGFMSAEDAMSDAYDDLRAHQFGLMVGMRAALQQILDRLSPAKIEHSLASKTTIENLFTANRKAKLWDQFVQLYSQISQECEDEDENIFNQTFRQAYEEQMARIKQK